MKIRAGITTLFSCLALLSLVTLAREPAAPSPTGVQAATPVSIEHIVRHTFVLHVSGPGKTAAFESHKIVAPFAGTLLTFHVSPGDQVHAKQVIGKILAETSVAQLEGAREMLKSAHSSRERSDAKRALELAKKSAVTKTIRSSEAGIVVTVNADEGVVVAKDQELMTLAPRDSIGFLAQIDQSHLAQIRRGQEALVKLAGADKTLSGHVHAVLPAGSPGDLRSPVRVDLSGSNPPVLGVFGTADVVIGRRNDVLAVPEGGVLRNDVMGTTKIAVVTQGDRAHWINVKTGISEGGLVEILSPPLSLSEPVIVDGQVGLPEGAKVRIRP